MGRWARALLVGAMLTWTALTAATGWFAFSPPSSGAPPLAVYDVASPDGGRVVQVLAEYDPHALNDAAAVAASLAADGDVAVRASDRVYAVPRYAEPAGFDERVRPAGVHRAPTPVPRRSAKGVIVLDPGHGRGDPGAVHYLPNGRHDITEAESNQLNAELIRDELVALGYEVYLTREGEGRGPGRPLPMQFIVSDLYWRAGLADAVDADVYLAIHGNGARVKSISGPETWYCGKHREGAANERLATLVQRAMMDALHEYGYDPPDRGIKEDAQSHHSGDFCQFVVTREAEVPAALLEFLFLTNDDDARVLVDRRSHEILARHVARAIDRFMQERAEVG